jgi:hypothetical protein
MSMAVYGLKPRNEQGKVFKNNIWWWGPLADYCIQIGGSLARKCRYWHYNQGDGLEDADSRTLAALLRAELESGRTAEYAMRYRAEQEALQEPLPFAVENVQEFTEFLENCGGFEIQ